jgi:polyphosphate kinase 2 (PPK2 family)
MERIDNPSKNWKFSAGDIAERGYWQAYQEAYAKAISATSKTHAPWYVIPADNKWFTRLSIATAIYKTFSGLDMHYPTLNKKQQEELVHSRRVLENE